MMTNEATVNGGSRSNGTNRTLRVSVIDSETKEMSVVSIHKLVPCQEGVFGKILGNNFNVFRPWNSQQWMTNISGSTRFNMETAGLSQAEIGIVINEAKAQERKAA